jgi:hypothetical protein
MAGEATVYHYVKVRHGRGDEDPVVEEEVLFPVKRASAGGLVLTLKPSSLPAGLATRMLGAVATGPWDSQPDDLRRIELSRDLGNSNLVAALGPAGASLYDLVDARVLGTMLSLGDAGGTMARFRDDWCSVSSISGRIPFRLERVIASIRLLL